METLSYTDKLSLNFSELKNTLPKFATKAQAIVAGKKYGWSTAIRLDDRFERLWVVGNVSFQPTYVAGIENIQYNFPLLRWDKKNCVEFCPVIKAHRIKNVSHK